MNSEGTNHLASDPVMAGLIARIGSFTLKPRRLPPFQSLVQSITCQQLSGKAADTILNRFRKLCADRGFPTAEQVLTVDPERLRSAGLSKPKANYIRGLAERAIAGSLPTLKECDRLTDEEIVERLTEIKGVGRWTAEMFLIFNLGRPDVLPVNDLGVRRGFQTAYGKRKMPEPEQLQKFGQRWKPYRSLASRYLWRAGDGG